MRNADVARVLLMAGARLQPHEIDALPFLKSEAARQGDGEMVALLGGMGVMSISEQAEADAEAASRAAQARLAGLPQLVEGGSYRAGDFAGACSAYGADNAVPGGGGMWRGS